MNKPKETCAQEYFSKIKAANKEKLSAIFPGRLRMEIKKFLKEEMEQIDEIVEGLIG